MKKTTSKKSVKRERRHAKIRARVSGVKELPRLSVFRSNKFIYAQLIDDDTNKTIVAVSDILIKDKKTKVERAKTVGQELAKLAKEKKIAKVVFDRGGFNYAGRVKALADGAREGGLTF
jgi:large subunit ribosomal protein L18